MRRLLFAIVCIAVCAAVLVQAGEDLAGLRQRARSAQEAGNWKDAYELWAKLCLDPQNDPLLVGQDLHQALACLQRLNRLNEIDDFREKVIATHKENWRLLRAAAQSYLAYQQGGYIIAGKFERGYHRGGGRWVDCYERDRVRSLQLMQEAMRKSKGEKNTAELAGFYLEFANAFLNSRYGQQAWRLQSLTDLTTLPDYDEPSYWSASAGAPVDEQGNPVYHKLPESFEKAQSDGERWRWCLMQAAELDPNRGPQIRLLFAQFLYEQFGEQTLAYYGGFFRSRGDDETNKDETGVWALHTLADDETIARLATGVRRIKMPAEFNFIKIFQEIATGDSEYARPATAALAQMYENRRQYPRAAEWWERYRRFDPAEAERRLAQIRGNWGQFEPVMAFAAGQGARVDFKFRNGRAVHFTAYRVKAKELIDDIKAYLKSNPPQLDWQKIQIEQIGWRLVWQNEVKYIGDKAAEWDLALQPRPDHFDRRITVTTPLQDAGVYLLVAQMKDGNQSRIIIWLDNTIIVRKPMHAGTLYFVADAASGQPLAKANLEFFGWRQEWVQGTNKHNILVQNFAENTDANGLATLTAARLPHDYQWLVTATAADGRWAYQGFSNVWYGQYYEQEYNAQKFYFITDRPVYRPGQAVKFKIWAAQAQYDREGKSPFAGQRIAVLVQDPRGEKAFENTFVADEFGGVDGELALAKEATLGVYHVSLPNRAGMVGSFRVEEYKKPEFEVKVEAPAEPAMLGETVTAQVSCRYYFGAAVTDAKVKYKVLRHAQQTRWYPCMPWDWFYGRGYWWFAYDYEWYPRWREWGCGKPIWWWWPARHTPPEIVAEAEAVLDKEGKAEIKIDTALAKAMHPDLDHRYDITVEVTDKSRRTIVGSGSVLAARKPFSVYAWVDRGHYQAGDTVHAEFQALTADQRPVSGKGRLALYRLSYDQTGNVSEQEVEHWDMATDAEGRASQKIQASAAGQYRIALKVKDAKGHEIEGGYVFVVRGQGFDARNFRFNQLELVPDKREYQPGEKVRLSVNADRLNAAVLLFLRPSNGIYLPPKLLRLQGKSALEEIEVAKRDMPNFFVEALTVADGKVHVETREIVVPPEKRVLEVAVVPDKAEDAPAAAEPARYKPGEKGKVRVKLTDFQGKPFAGSAVLTVYDKSVEYISGGSNVPEIKEFFWKWRRHHRPCTESSMERWFAHLMKENEIAMASLGIFGDMVADEEAYAEGDGRVGGRGYAGRDKGMLQMKMGKARSLELTEAAAPSSAPVAARALAKADEADAASQAAQADAIGAEAAGGPTAEAQPTVRTAFADTALWVAKIQTDADGIAVVDLPMPENLTTWKIRVWAMGYGARCGEGATEVITSKNLLVRLQAPRFFTQKDEVVLSANVHNYLKTRKKVRAVLELAGQAVGSGEQAVLALLAGRDNAAERTIEVEPNGEARVDWRVKVNEEGEAVVRMKALTDEESDAMEMRFPAYVHGMEKLVPACGVIRPEKESAAVVLEVPKERRVNASRLEIRYSPTLALAMVDALPYLVEYPYWTTDTTLNRFLPTVITRKTLLRLGVNLKDVRDKRVNLNAQELGDAAERAKQWKKDDRTVDAAGNWGERNPVFDEAVVADMVKAGVQRLTNMQCSDGGWGWFSGYGEYPSPHTTALVVRGLMQARENDVALVPGVLERGIAWLQRYQANEVQALKNAEDDPEGKRHLRPWKRYADNLDALVYTVLAEAKVEDAKMREYLYRDRNHLSIYAKAMLATAYHRQGHKEKVDMLRQNVEQFLVQDDENQTAYLRLGNEGYWWWWYGSEIEAHAWYLKLLALVDPKGETASRLVKYLLNNRKHATYWHSTRDTALCVEAFADYLKASGEDKPDLTVEVLVDGKKHKEVKINPDNLFVFDNQVVIAGDAVETGKHTIELRKKGIGPLYFNVYLSYFTLEDFIPKAGMEIKVQRKVYRLKPADKTAEVAGSRGQVVKQKVEKYLREELKSDDTLKSGDLVEVELEIESKNDYEYIVFEDRKAAGFEPVEVRSGYTGNDLGAYVEFRDERVAFFVRQLARGNHSVSYRLRAEIPGCFSALPARGYAMYAPELKGNSDEIKLRIED